MGEWGPASVLLCVLSGKKPLHLARSFAAVFFHRGDRSVSSAFISGKVLPGLLFNFGDFWHSWHFWQSARFVSIRFNSRLSPFPRIFVRSSYPANPVHFSDLSRLFHSLQGVVNRRHHMLVFVQVISHFCHAVSHLGRRQRQQQRLTKNPPNRLRQPHLLPSPLGRRFILL